MVFVSGLVAGVAAACALAKMAATMISNLLYGLSATDSLNIAGAGLIMLATGIVACLVPARRAARIDPLTAIRYE